jgi:hypothetical protein
VKAVNLEIPLPGAPVVVQLRDAEGKAAPGRNVTLEHEGPLSSLWPKQWTSDGAGVVYIPTLEAGRHVIRGPGVAKPVTVNVPPLPGKRVALEIRVDRK